LTDVDHLPVIGVPIFCTFCGRQLVSFNPDGTFNLAGKTTVRGSAGTGVDEYGEIEVPEEMVITDATCHRRPCRAKRWLYDKRRT
jgi:hypothetical protein